MYYCINWSWSVFDKTVEGGSSSTPMVAAHLSVLLNTGRGIDTKTCGVGDVIAPDDRWFGSDINTRAFINYVYFDG